MKSAFFTEIKRRYNEIKLPNNVLTRFFILSRDIKLLRLMEYRFPFLYTEDFVLSDYWKTPLTCVIDNLPYIIYRCSTNPSKSRQAAGISLFKRESEGSGSSRFLSVSLSTRRPLLSVTLRAGGEREGRS